MRYLPSICLGLMLSGLAAPANAASITCAGTHRSFTLGDATLCTQGISANPNGTLINAQGGAWAGSWENEGELTAAGINDWFTVALTTGAFGGGDVSGTWTINPLFWATWGKAVISVHVGEGGGDPDWWLFMVEPGDQTGTWSYVINSGTGGGLSNLKLWGSGAPSQQQLLSAPEPATMMLLGSALAGLAFHLKRRRRIA
jgi:hypothetical protein